MTLVIDGKPFRETIQQIAEQANVNVWIDRQVDPTTPVAAGQLGPTAYESFQQVAAQRDCVVMAAANIVLIGRPGWVDMTAASILPSVRTLARVDIRWDLLTTPSEALAITTGTEAAELPALPHDLWPAVHWQQLSRPVATNLVLSQFNRRTQETQTVRTLEIVPAVDAKPVTRRYTTDEKLKPLIAQIDPTAQIKTLKSATAVTATAKSHRLISAKLLKQAAAKVGAGNKTDDRTFSLKLVNKMAGAAITQFAQASNQKCEIRPDATQACSQLISLDANNKTLNELMELVAAQAGVSLTFDDGTVVVTAAPPAK
ncbi:MAG: hypothetical protein HKN47_04635 [Pirellulaceae bacterium]|nr:hypothetical protein [Pirellulaceae bacterium]